MQDAKIVPSKFTKLKNSSDVDMVVFGHDQDGSGDGPNQDMEDLEASPLFFGSAGVHTTDASLKEAAMWYGGPKGRRTTIAGGELTVQQPSPDSQEARRHLEPLRCKKPSIDIRRASGGPLLWRHTPHMRA